MRPPAELSTPPLERASLQSGVWVVWGRWGGVCGSGPRWIERAVGGALTYIGATTRSGAMAYPYLLTLKLTRGVLMSSGHLLNSIGLF